MFFDFFKRFSMDLGDSYVKKIKKKVKLSGLQVNYKKWAGFLFLFSGFFSFIVCITAFSVYSLTNIFLLMLLFLGVFAILHLISDLILSMFRDSRVTFTEAILPDFFYLTSANIKSGITIDKALLLSSRREFKYLSDEVIKAAKKALSGIEIQQSLEGISGYIDSHILKRSIQLIKEGIASGSEISSLLKGIADDIRSTVSIREKMKSSIRTYTVLFIIASCFGAPFLYSVATNLVDSLSELNQIQTPPISVITPKSPVGTKINPTFITLTIVLTLIINSIFASLMIGLLERGKMMRGIRLIPVFLSISLLMYFVSTTLLSGLL